MKINFDIKIQTVNGFLFAMRIKRPTDLMAPAAVTKPTTKLWKSIDRKCKRFKVTKRHGPKWNKIFRRVTIDNKTNKIIEDLKIDKTVSMKQLRRKLPEGTRNITTKFYYVTGTAQVMMPTISGQTAHELMNHAGEESAKNVLEK